MKDIRTKQSKGAPKALDKATLLPQHMKNVLVSTRDKAKELDTRDAHANPEGYATDQISKKASDESQKAAHETINKSRQIINRGRQELKKRIRKNANQTAKGTIKTVDKSIKTARHTVKATTRTIKTSAQAAKTTAKTTKMTAKASIRTVQATAKAAVTAIKLTAKAVVTAVKATAAAIKSLIAAIAAGGWIVLVIIIVVGAILFIINSAFGLFYSNEETGDAGTITMSQAIADINGEFMNYLDQKADDASAGHDNVTVNYDNDTDSDSFYINNWVDVLGIYAVKETMSETGSIEVATMTKEKEQILKGVYWDMNTVSVKVTTETDEDSGTDSEGNPTTVPVEKTTINISVNSLDYSDAAGKYGFTSEQNKMLGEIMAPENYPLFVELIGVDCYGGLTADELAELEASLPVGDKGADIVRYALTRLGNPYSMSKRGTGNYVDCSYLAWWAYNKEGIYIPSTSVTQAKYCYDHGYVIQKSELKAGDLIFWTKTSCHCGRWHEIHHVAIYVGNNKIIEARASKGCVVLDNLWGLNGETWQVYMYARPYYG